MKKPHVLYRCEMSFDLPTSDIKRLSLWNVLQVNSVKNPNIRHDYFKDGSCDNNENSYTVLMD